MISYATREDLYRYGLPRGILANPAQSVARVDEDGSAFELDGHGFTPSTKVLFRAEVGGTLPPPISAGTVYYCLPLDDFRFQVAILSGGGAVVLTGPGENLVVATSREAEIDEALEHFSRLVDTYLPAHAVPFTEEVPSVVRALVAELAAVKLLRQGGQASATAERTYEEAFRQLARIAKGLPLRGDVRATARTNLATADSAAPGAAGDPGLPSGDLTGGLSGWLSGCGRCF